MTAESREGSKAKEVFVCEECGRESLKWLGRCPSCGNWNTFKAIPVERKTSSSLRSHAHVSSPCELISVDMEESVRLTVGLREIDRVLGGGLVPGSLVLVGGEPGVGKSTLLLQICAHVASCRRLVVYVSGEESARQVRLRSLRLGINGENIIMLPDTNLNAVLDYLSSVEPALVIVDSIQTMFLEGVVGAAGSLGQVRECTVALMRYAKDASVPVVMAGHVTKEGSIAGPGVLEHIVDVVLYMEGERHSAYRLVRGVKNRFGSTDELGVFEMVSSGLVEVENPSTVFMGRERGDVIGSVIVPVLEGTRPLLVEIQALSTPAGYGPPRRVGNGFDVNRLLLITAVLSRRARLKLSNQDIIVNVTGGFRINEPAADLGVALAIVSSVRDQPLRHRLVVFGELGLGGEVRAVSQPSRRLAEASRLGFEQCILPSDSRLPDGVGDGIRLLLVESLGRAASLAFEGGAPRK
ncbi:MAG TPA: DNA repair protein RadA [Dehalococcoidia bacterium]|nr:DNA repair protein RadA [Dehalococcoidia bacterium]